MRGAIAGLWVVVLIGLLGLLAGWFDTIDPIEGAWISPDGELLLLRGSSGVLLVHEAAHLDAPVARSEDESAMTPLAWADGQTLVVRRGEALTVLDLTELSERMWFSTASPTVVLGREGRTLIAVDPAAEELPLVTFALANWQVSRRDPPATWPPFEEALPAADAVPEGVSLELSAGRLVYEHPLMDSPRQVALPRPRVLPAVIILSLAVLLVVLRYVDAWRRRHRPRPVG
jgi:hypothetical protein